MAADSRRGSAELPPLPPRLPASRRSSAELPPHPALEDIDPSTRFLYTPHTISALLIGGLCARALCVWTPERLWLLSQRQRRAAGLCSCASSRGDVQKKRTELFNVSELCLYLLHYAPSPPAYQPVSGAGVALVVYYSKALNPPPSEPGDLQTAYFNVRHGIIAAALVYLGAKPACFLQLPKAYIVMVLCSFKPPGKLRLHEAKQNQSTFFFVQLVSCLFLSQ